jgi:proteic killer suppression protein
VDIEFSSKKLEKECNDSLLLKRKHGEQRARLIRRRLDEMRAAPNLAVLRTLPGPRCHELVGDRKGQLSVDLDHPYRLIFEVNQSPVPENPSGGLDWAQVTQIIVVEIVDTHK